MIVTDPDNTPAPPIAKRIATVSEIHGEHRVDDYAWLRDKPNPDVAAYLEAENAFDGAVFEPTKPLQERLYAEMLGRIKETAQDRRQPAPARHQHGCGPRRRVPPL